jgi:hypothetical protein
MRTPETSGSTSMAPLLCTALVAEPDQLGNRLF